MRKNKIILNDRTGINCLFLIWTVLIFCRYGLEIGISTVIILLVAILIISFGNVKEIIAVVICCIPLYTTFNYMIALLYGNFVLLIKFRKKIKIDLMLFISILIFIWELSHGFIGPFSFKEFIYFVTPYITLLLINACDNSDIDYDYLGIMFARFVALSGISLFYRTVSLNGGNVIHAVQNMGRLGLIDEGSFNIGGQINPNSFGIMCVLAIAILFQSYFYKSKNLKKIIFIIVLIILGALTVSKTYIVLLVLTICLFIVTGKKQKKQLIGAVLAVIGVGSFILLRVFPTIVDTFIGRWSAEDLSTGRLSIMFESYEAIWANPELFMFGVGIQDYSDKTQQFVAIAPHDFINELLMIWGIPGLIIFLALIISVVLAAKKKNKNVKLINLIPLIIIIAKSFSGHWITSGYTMLAISLAYLSLAYDFQNIHTIKESDIYREND